ncbi:cytochrome P450 [Earliella scabrosa]|nr:cytochrome P450 [Earliella scabrosa]
MSLSVDDAPAGWLQAVSALICISLSVRAALYVRDWLTRGRSASLPPGPPGWPIIGNALDFPKHDRGRGFKELSAKYGDLARLKVFGQHTIVLGSYEVACELLDKRSAIYSDRPDMVMGKLTSFAEWSLIVLRYGPQWRAHRRVFHQELLPNSIVRYQPLQRRVAHQLLHDLLESPQLFTKHVERAFAGTALSVAYGLEIPKGDETYLHEIREMLETATAFTVPGKYLVEALPALQYLPQWFPGATFKREAAVASMRIRAILRQLLHAGIENLTHGIPRDSILASMLRNSRQASEEADAEEQEMCAGIAATVYNAGADTTEATIQAFILAMALYPEVQKKAQAELDNVIGSQRLPDFCDRSTLPYVNALVKELARWHVVAPTGVPHAAVRDDVYNGFLIPKGSLVIPNLWAYSRDPSVYPDPERFNPDRFLKDGKLNPEVRDPYSFIFGFGRRICPGRHLADASLFIVCASILQVFTVSPPVDAHGNPLPLEAKFTKHLVSSSPVKFKCEIRARSPEAEALIGLAAVDADA